MVRRHIPCLRGHIKDKEDVKIPQNAPMGPQIIKFWLKDTNNKRNKHEYEYTISNWRELDLRGFREPTEEQVRRGCW